MRRAMAAKCSVLQLSSACAASGAKQASISARPLPRSPCHSSCVSRLSL
jgi:hypothetical protein